LAASRLEEAQSVEVQLIDESDAAATTQPANEAVGAVLESKTIEIGGDSKAIEVEFRVHPDRVGSRSYRVRVQPLPAEDNLANNSDSVAVYVHDDKARVLYVEGGPRFEYRYLKNALLREATIRASCLLLDADAEFAQEGDDPIARFPDDPEKLADYDVVIFGDVDPTGDWLSAKQAQMLVDFVSEKGGGFALIAGPSHAPHRFRNTLLEKLIPVRIDPEFLGRYDSPLAEGFRPALTPEGRNSRIFRLGRDPEADGEVFEGLPPLYWIARTLGPKAGVDVLAEHPTMTLPTGPMPLFVAGHYGAGKVLFIATDDTWRWRQHTGEFLHDTFWVQLVRSLMPLSASGVDRRLAITSDRPRYSLADRVDITVEVKDPELLSMLSDSVRLTVEDASGVVRENLQAERLLSASNIFEASFVPGTAGRSVIHCRDIPPTAGDRPARCTIVVDVPDAEARQPQANHEVLERLAGETGGEVVEFDQMAEALAGIRDRSVRIPDDYHEPLWDSKLVLILFAGLIATEWGLRKIFGMV
jgi:uncharacterized membrane protein